MNIRLIATDLDGTLVPAGKSTPEKVLLTLSQVMQAGIYLVPVTGRTLTSLPPEILSLSGIRYIISSNGAVITDMQSNERIHETLIPAGVAAEILTRLQAYPVYSSVYINNQVYNRAELPDFIHRRYRNLDHFHKNRQADLARFVEQNGYDAEKIFVAVDDPEIRRQIRLEMGGIPGVQLTSSAPYNLEFNRMDADKGKALAWLCEYLGIPTDNVLAMGDNENDHSMLRLAGLSIAPENASPETKKMVSQVVADCQKGGTADFLKEWILRT